MEFLGILNFLQLFFGKRQIKIGGLNQGLRLNIKINQTNSNDTSCISPLLSFSAGKDHMTWITKDGKGFEFGNNIDD